MSSILNSPVDRVSPFQSLNSWFTSKLTLSPKSHWIQIYNFEGPLQIFSAPENANSQHSLLLCECKQVVLEAKVEMNLVIALPHGGDITDFITYKIAHLRRNFNESCTAYSFTGPFYEHTDAQPLMDTGGFFEEIDIEVCSAEYLPAAYKLKIGKIASKTMHIPIKSYTALVQVNSFKNVMNAVYLDFEAVPLHKAVVSLHCSVAPMRTAKIFVKYDDKTAASTGYYELAVCAKDSYILRTESGELIDSTQAPPQIDACIKHLKLN